MAQVITQEHIKQAMSYEQYIDLVHQLLSEDKTTGPNQSEEMIAYTRLNVQRMRRLNKTIILDDLLVEKLSNLTKPWIWLVLTEAWCGDAAQNIPVLAKMAGQTANIKLHLLLRDEHPEIMEAYLTDGGRSIPKLICLTPDLTEVGTWGPRPVAAQQIMAQYKTNPGIDKKVFIEAVQEWYAKDKTKSMQQEFVLQLEKLSTQ